MRINVKQARFGANWPLQTIALSRLSEAWQILNQLEISLMSEHYF